MSTALLAEETIRVMGERFTIYRNPIIAVVLVKRYDEKERKYLIRPTYIEMWRNLEGGVRNTRGDDVCLESKDVLIGTITPPSIAYHLAIWPVDCRYGPLVDRLVYGVDVSLDQIRKELEEKVGERRTMEKAAEEMRQEVEVKSFEANLAEA